MDAREQIDHLANTIREKFAVKRIILFGSQAYGHPDGDSDIDLCVITDLKGKRKIEVMRDIRREVRSVISQALDILVYDETEFADRAGLKTTLEYKILTEGETL
ncbi:MAG: nucleotidyltransferase domain-containing protein [bacterium]